MSSANASRKYLLIAGKILLLLIVLIGALQSGSPASYYDSYGVFFVLVGGVALMMISFPGAEIGRALRHAAGGSGSDAELRNSAHFWEAAARSFWILGGLRSVLSMVTGFAALATEETAGMPLPVPMLIRALLSTFYGSLFAVICFVPCWKLLGKLPCLASTPGTECGDTPLSVDRSGWGFGTIIGYVLFLAVLISTVQLPNFGLLRMIGTAFRSPLLVVLGGTLALILFVGENKTRPTSSAAFAGMGLIGSLMGFIQMLHGITISGPKGIGHVAGALVFVLASCFTALLGMAIIGAPSEDRAIRLGQTSAPSVFSRVSWYAFPLLSLVFLVLVFIMMIVPLSPPR
jgi:hypothetical protein